MGAKVNPFGANLCELNGWNSLGRVLLGVGIE